MYRNLLKTTTQHVRRFISMFVYKCYQNAIFYNAAIYYKKMQKQLSANLFSAQGLSKTFAKENKIFYVFDVFDVFENQT